MAHSCKKGGIFCLGSPISVKRLASIRRECKWHHFRVSSGAKLVVSAGDIARISMSMSFNFSPCELVVLRTSSVTSQT